VLINGKLKIFGAYQRRVFMGLQSRKSLCYVPVLTADCDKYSCAGPDSQANIEPVLNAQRRYGGGGVFPGGNGGKKRNTWTVFKRRRIQSIQEDHRAGKVAERSEMWNYQSLF